MTLTWWATELACRACRRCQGYNLRVQLHLPADGVQAAEQRCHSWPSCQQGSHFGCEVQQAPESPQCLQMRQKCQAAPSPKGACWLGDAQSAEPAASAPHCGARGVLRQSWHVDYTLGQNAGEQLIVILRMTSLTCCC